MQLLKKNKVPERERDSRYTAKRKKSKFKRRSVMIFFKVAKKICVYDDDVFVHT